MGETGETDLQVQVFSVVEERYGRLRKGSGILGRPDVAQIVEDAIRFKRGERHLLHAWCILLNHVHFVTTPLPPFELSEIMHSIKSFSSLEINRLLSRSGPLWERESFDHMIRSVEHFEEICSYVEQNPVKAGLCAQPEEWQFSSASPGKEIDLLEHWIDQRKTPFAPLTSRGELPHLYKDGATYFVTFRLLDAIKF